MAEGGERGTEGVEEPVVGYIQCGSPQLESARGGALGTGGGDLFFNGLGEVVEQQDKALAGTDSQAGWDEFGVAGEAAVAVALDAGDGERDGGVSQLGFTEESEIFAGKDDAVFAEADGVVAEAALDGGVASAGAAG